MGKSPGTFRASFRIKYELAVTGKISCERIEEIIEQETAAGDLLESCEALLDLSTFAVTPREGEIHLHAMAAIRSAKEGPRA